MANKCDITHIELIRLFTRTQKIEAEAQKLVAGRRAKIISNYNGQPYGNSRPSLKGKIFDIQGAFMEGDGVYLWLYGQDLSVNLKEVEILEP